MPELTGVCEVCGGWYPCTRPCELPLGVSELGPPM
jgi:hypothetical protein